MDFPLLPSVPVALEVQISCRKQKVGDAIRCPSPHLTQANPGFVLFFFSFVLLLLFLFLEGKLETPNGGISQKTLQSSTVVYHSSLTIQKPKRNHL